MRCPSCHKKNSGKLLHCVYCGSDLYTSNRFDFASFMMIIIASVQIILLTTVICMLANGNIATYYLKNNKLDTVYRITSTFHSAEKNKEFQKLLKEKVSLEVNEYMEGEKSAENAISSLERYHFSDSTGFSGVDDAIATIQAQQKILDDYAKAKDDVNQALSKGDIEGAVRILHQIGEKYPQYKAETDHTVQETITNALTDVDEQIEGIENDMDLDVDYPDYVNSVYDDAVSVLQHIVNAEIDSQYISSASERLESCYLQWLNYNQKIGRYWGQNGAFALAAICEEYNDSGHYLASINGSCTGYYQAQIQSGEGESVYKEISTHKTELSDYSDAIDITVYDSLKQQALEQWTEHERKQYAILVNQCRADAGLPELTYNTSVEAAADALVETLDKWNDKDYVSAKISEYVPGWNHAWRVSHEQYLSASSAIAGQKDDENSYLYLADPTQIGVGFTFTEDTMRFDWVVIVLC